MPLPSFVRYANLVFLDAKEGTGNVSQSATWLVASSYNSAPLPWQLHQQQQQQQQQRRPVQAQQPDVGASDPRIIYLTTRLLFFTVCRQCFDAAGWASVRAPGL